MKSNEPTPYAVAVQDLCFVWGRDRTLLQKYLERVNRETLFSCSRRTAGGDKDAKLVLLTSI